jgi:hypothetical protein
LTTKSLHGILGLLETEREAEMNHTVEQFEDGRIRIYDRQTGFASEWRPDGGLTAGIFEDLICLRICLEICEREAN